MPARPATLAHRPPNPLPLRTRLATFKARYVHSDSWFTRKHVPNPNPNLNPHPNPHPHPNPTGVVAHHDPLTCTSWSSSSSSWSQHTAHTSSAALARWRTGLTPGGRRWARASAASRRCQSRGVCGDGEDGEKEGLGGGGEGLLHACVGASWGMKTGAQHEAQHEEQHEAQHGTAWQFKAALLTRIRI
jgi:hypothetical protein